MFGGASSLGLGDNGGLSSSAAKADYIASKSLTYMGTDQLNFLTVYWNNMAHFSNYDPVQTVELYEDASSNLYVFATNNSGVLHAIETDQTSSPSVHSDVELGSGSSVGGNIRTQDAAQKALVAINNAVVSKDKIRASLGALQNRLENTVSNLQTQAENLQSAESRISDVDVASEMTQFVREQILTQSSVAMLSQANSMPKMAMQIIGG